MKESEGEREQQMTGGEENYGMDLTDLTRTKSLFASRGRDLFFLLFSIPEEILRMPFVARHSVAQW